MTNAQTHPSQHCQQAEPWKPSPVPCLRQVGLSTCRFFHRRVPTCPTDGASGMTSSRSPISTQCGIMPGGKAGGELVERHNRESIHSKSILRSWISIQQQQLLQVQDNARQAVGLGTGSGSEASPQRHGYLIPPANLFWRAQHKTDISNSLVISSA